MTGANQGSTQDRIVTEAMRLFGEQGYAATTIAQIEEAAGLSPGSGGLYRHFKSKHELLAEGVRQQIEEGEVLVTFLDDPDAVAELPLRERLALIARAGLNRLEQERDINRMLMRDLSQFPELLEQMKVGEIQRVHRAVTPWLAAQAGQNAPARDWAALSSVLIGAIVHYWMLRDIFGSHPTGVHEDDYLAAFVEIAVGLFDDDREDTP